MLFLATISPSASAMDDTLSTCSFAENVKAIVNKPMASSSFVSTCTDEIPPSLPTINTTSEHKSIKSWQGMEANLHFMKTQMEEAQAVLAQKFLDQEALEEKLENYEIQKQLLEEKLSFATSNNIKLVKDLEAEVQKRELVQEQLDITESTLMRGCVCGKYSISRHVL